ncbi:uncharacterized protein [Ptychodera flava]|uniref:uncharacterized protein n=1 Tax=Ptychodera flava TaxID=63121 RepID=UPI003969E5F0
MDLLRKTSMSILLLAVICARGFSLDCYSCDSKSSSNENCANLREDIDVISCAGKCKTVAEYVANHLTAVTRGCGNPCRETGKGFVLGSGTETSCCNENLCNNQDASVLSLHNSDQANRCYVCTYPHDNSCLEPNSATFVESVQSICSKCSTKVSYVDEHVTEVIRECNPVCTAYDETFDGTGTVTSCCDSILCNADKYQGSAGHVIASVIVMATSAVSSILMTNP